MNIVLSIVFQIIASLFILLVLLISWRYIRRKISSKAILLVDLAFFFSVSKIILYYMMPSILRAFSGMLFELEAGVEPIAVAHIYLIELISWMFWLLPFYLYLIFNGTSVPCDYSDSDLRVAYSKRFLIFLVVGFFVTRLQLLLSGEVSGPLIVFQSVFSYPGKAAGPLLFILSMRYFDKKSFFLGGMGTLVGIASYGTRGALVYSAILILFISLFILKSKRVNKFIIVSFLLFSASYFVLGGLAGVSYTVSDDGGIQISAGLNQRKINQLSSVEKIEDRFGAPTRIGSAFINLYDRGDAANGMPILNSALAFLPRSINPDKPHPNTLIGDDLYSQGMYIIFREVYGYNTFQMVEFPTGGHFYWQFGYVGVVVLSLISGVYILVSIVFYSRFGLVGVAFLFGTFKPWGYVDPKIWVSDIILQLYQVVLPILTLTFAVGLMLKILKLGKK